ncbi:2-amino-3,7-dideoxy-D-threo-hept-6-ulosonate synthase [Luedemannella helvata]|uniref:2-amino-3,7-dideoxy-D-threo-hept-6-ulosonate synthase n=1 Tax=Luedemannella helvata TaxID=349315 RepID=A0ABN2JTC8_9ACTN
MHVFLHDSFARQLRLGRLRKGDSRLFVVPLDHSVSTGPVVRDGRLDDLVEQIGTNGADAVVLHKGSLRRVDPRRFGTLSLIVHLSASTAHAADPDAKVLVATVEEALSLGADAVSVHVNLGSAQEGRQIADLATVAGACHRWGVPLLAMVYPRGPRLHDPADPDLVAHAAALAAELGADLVKTVFPGSAQAMADVARSCPIPILVAGGPTGPADDDLFGRLHDAVRGGAAGVAVGRHVFASANPAAVVSKISGLVHDAALADPHETTGGRA